MLYREIIAVCSQIHTKHINTLRGQNVGLLNVNPGGTYSDHWALNGYTTAFNVYTSSNFTVTDLCSFSLQSAHVYLSSCSLNQQLFCLNSRNRLVLAIGVLCVHCAVRTGLFVLLNEFQNSTR
jgi:hypothetical protein